MCDVPAWRGGRCTCALVKAKGGEKLTSFRQDEFGGLCAGVRVGVDVGHRPKWCFRLRLMKRSLDELKDESSSSNGTAAVRLMRKLNRSNEQGTTAS